ncbi:GNAT family N-acetyltransferase [Brachybacterium paraconglomeratum]|uniref:GNAT family N-acetyltransferase n=1 Tax=Brachybacterium paraconglomeratum TaxID=173362 RepID=UPI003FD2B7CC
MISLRPAARTDVPRIVELVQAAYRGQGGWTTEAHLVDGHRTDTAEVRAMLADPAVTLLVATGDGNGADDGGAGVDGGSAERVLGCCYTRREAPDEHGAVRAELGLFAVDPAAQGAGLGGRLLEAQAASLAADGVDVLMIQVLQSRPELHRWYERHGFTGTGQAVPFAGDAALLKVEGLGMDIMERPLPVEDRVAYPSA